jgi:type IV secretory pathway VirB4 component
MPKPTATTQQHLDIEDIRDNLVILKNGAVAGILKTTAVNFDLLSEIEQDAIIAAFSMLINSITFPIQIVIRSKRLDISSYLEKVTKQEKKIEDPLLKHQAEAYRKYIQETITNNEVLDKKFYIVVSTNRIIGGGPGSGNPFDFLVRLMRPSNTKSSVDVQAALKEAQVDLEPKLDHIQKEFRRIGIKADQLETQELVELFFDIYNPSSVHGQRIKTNISDYQTAIVNPAIFEE